MVNTGDGEANVLHDATVGDEEDVEAALAVVAAAAAGNSSSSASACLTCNTHTCPSELLHTPMTHCN